MLNHSWINTNSSTILYILLCGVFGSIEQATHCLNTGIEDETQFGEKR